MVHQWTGAVVLVLESFSRISILQLARRTNSRASLRRRLQGRKQQVPPLRFAPVGMTQVLFVTTDQPFTFSGRWNNSTSTSERTCRRRRRFSYDASTKAENSG